MLKEDIIFPLVSLIVSVIGYIVTYNLIIACVIFVIYISYYFLIARKKIIKYKNQIERVNYCYHFINSFLVTLSVKESFEDAYQSATRIGNQNFNDLINSVENLNVYDRVSYLRSYFNLSIYKMFINILDLYQDQGGNILSLSDNLIRECTRVENVLNETLSIGRKHIVEFILLWVMSFGIILFMRFGISQFYVTMVEMPLFVIMLFIFFIICIVSIHLFLCSYTNLTIKEDAGQ